MLVDTAAGRPTLPQELIDLILDRTDEQSLIACARVARSFRHTSQKHIFANVMLRPAFQYRRGWLRSKALTFKRFSQILSNSPHLAAHVHSLTLIEGTGLGSPKWMRKDAFPPLLSMLVNLTTISIGSDSLIDWDSFPPTLITGLQATVGLPSLTSVRLHHLRFDRSAELASFLQRCKNVESLVFSQLAFKNSGDNNTGVLDTRTALSSLTMHPSLIPVIHSVTNTFDVRSLEYLHTTVSSPALETETQHLLDATENLAHCHVELDHHHTDSSIINLQALACLRTLEITLFFELSTTPDGFDPVGWTGNILATSRDPSPIQHVVLNINVEEQDISDLFRLKELERFLVAPTMSSLRRLTVNLDSSDLDFDLYSCERDLSEAFPILSSRGMLAIGLFGVS
ncbi:hypothetical protein MSAN_00218900 [Mycena sanguinolenta]|uniref:F-box domain-containing protein n=1 Tax=Mycena sanguinolenta TaxID=230812 RepID=A0A8H7DKX6_9AGAR|nr:hypothetical protein MSAN_00218900 [Mycena sanguinolenta]